MAGEAGAVIMATFRELLVGMTPKLVRRYLKDVFENVRRHRPGPQVGLSKHNLVPSQIYPVGTNFYTVMNSATLEKLSGVGLTPATPVTSIGTCFAEEFAYFMRDHNFNYVRTEKDVFSASANWGRVYTVPNLLQIVSYSTVASYPVYLEQTELGWFDPLREAGASYLPTREAAHQNVLAHRKASYDAFTKCEVLIITVGQNEAWTDSVTGQVWATIPPRAILDARRKNFSVSEFSFEKNLAALTHVVNIVQEVNPDVRILFTVSPVASYASFSDIDVVSQSFANKCLLRAVVNTVVASQPGKLFYFPSFEMVLCYNPFNFRADNRHVKYATVDRIFSLLSKSTSLR